MRPIPSNVRSSEWWLPVVGYEGLYDVSRWGWVYSVISGKILKQCFNAAGYAQVGLYKDGRGRTIRVHRIVMEAFVGPCPEGMQVNHKDGDKTNNALSNLEYVTCYTNYKHAISTGLRIYFMGDDHFCSRLKSSDIPVIKERHVNGESYRRIADDYGVDRTTIGCIIRGLTWSHVV